MDDVWFRAMNLYITTYSDINEDCLQALSFPEMDLRENQIRCPVNEICERLFRHGTYVDFSDRRQELLWSDADIIRNRTGTRRRRNATAKRTRYRGQS